MGVYFTASHRLCDTIPRDNRFGVISAKDLSAAYLDGGCGQP